MPHAQSPSLPRCSRLIHPALFTFAQVTHEILVELPFSSERARMSVVTRAPDGTLRLLCKVWVSQTSVLLARGARITSGSNTKAFRKATAPQNPTVMDPLTPHARCAGNLVAAAAAVAETLA